MPVCGVFSLLDFNLVLPRNSKTELIVTKGVVEIDKLTKVFDAFENTLMIVGAAAIFVMMLLVTSDVSARQFFNSPIAGQPEITEMLMVFSVYLGMAYTQRDGGHIGLDILINRMPDTLRIACQWITHILSLIINGIVAVYALLQAIQAFTEGTRSIFLYWPMWPLPFAVALGSFILCLRLIVDLVTQSKIIKQKTEATIDA